MLRDRYFRSITDVTKTVCNTSNSGLVFFKRCIILLVGKVQNFNPGNLNLIGSKVHTQSMQRPAIKNGIFITLHLGVIFVILSIIFVCVKTKGQWDVTNVIYLLAVKSRPQRYVPVCSENDGPQPMR